MNNFAKYMLYIRSTFISVILSVVITSAGIFIYTHAGHSINWEGVGGLTLLATVIGGVFSVTAMLFGAAFAILMFMNWSNMRENVDKAAVRCVWVRLVRSYFGSSVFVGTRP